MFSRTWFAMMLFGSIGLPYLFSSSFGSSKTANPNGSPEAASPAHPPGESPAGAKIPGGPALPGPTFDDLGQVFRWDLSSAWVLAHWPRVSAGLAEVELQGYRVPLVTGTASDDLAGSLTYYFNRNQRVQRMTFFGTTGDARRLVALMATRFGFTRELTDDPSLFLYRVRDGKKVASELRIEPAHVIRADTPHRRFDVALWIERPRQMP
ncbi:MAG TPA: DUF6690 family protein [Pirellulales bacterium]|nr:DUF6690 family protein [Pirellulales bacterium]